MYSIIIIHSDGVVFLLFLSVRTGIPHPGHDVLRTTYYRNLSGMFPNGQKEVMVGVMILEEDMTWKEMEEVTTPRWTTVLRILILVTTWRKILPRHTVWSWIRNTTWDRI
jgi:hypothetical protein